jgi:CHASE1-domain containing sensor protein
MKYGGPVRHFAPIVAVGIVSVAASVAVWHLTRASEHRALVEEFSSRAHNQATILQGGVDDYLDELRSVRALFDSSNSPVSREQFESFSNSLIAGHAAILNIAWIPRVRREERATHERAAADDGLQDYHIRTITSDGSLPVSAERDEYFQKFYSGWRCPFNLSAVDAPHRARGPTWILGWLAGVCTRAAP